MAGMIQSFYKTFEEFIVEFTGRRLVGAVLLLSISMGAFWTLDHYSPYFRMARLERATVLLGKLVEIDATTQKNMRKDLLQLRTDIALELQRLVQPKGATIATGAPSIRRLRVLKFLSGIGAWFLFAVVYAIARVRSDPSAWSGVMGALLLGSVFGIIALFIPSDWATVGVLIAYGVGNFLLFVFAVLIWQARKTARAKTINRRQP